MTVPSKCCLTFSTLFVSFRPALLCARIFIWSLSLGRVSHSRGRNILPITYNGIHSFRSTIISKQKSKDRLHLCCHFECRAHNPCCFRYCSLKLSSGLRVCGEF